MIYIKAYNSAGKLIKTINAKQKTYLRKNIKIAEERGTNYNGYGYADTIRKYENMTLAQVREFNKIGKEKTKPKKTEEEKEITWVNRLSKLTGITTEEAQEIAQEKKEYKDRQIELLEERQIDNLSIKRQRLINKIEKSNPLRRIVDSEHAQNILSASNRHNGNYENLLDEGRELAAAGEIEKSQVREYARSNFNYK